MNGQKRIETMFAFVALDPADNTERILGARMTDGTYLPLVGADMERMESLKPIARKIAMEIGLAPGALKLLHFTNREEIEEIA